MSTDTNATRAAEFRALGRLMRHARAEGYTYYVTTVFGITDWSWSKGNVYTVVATPRSSGWSVDLPTVHVDLRPASVQQLTDVLVALGLLPVEFSSAHIAGRQSMLVCGNSGDFGKVGDLRHYECTSEEHKLAMLGNCTYRDVEDGTYLNARFPR